MKKIIYKSLLQIRDINFKNEYLKIKNINSLNKFYSFQLDSFNNLYEHANKNVEYYNVLANIYPLESFERIIEIPILTKKIIRENNKKLYSKDYKKRKYLHNSSGGSTGEPLKFLQDKDYVRWSNAANYYYYNSILNIDELYAKKILLWGSENDLFKTKFGFKSKIKNICTNTISLNTFRMKKEDMDKYIKKINSFKPELIRGYAGSLYEICKYAERTNKTLHTPLIVVSAAETLRKDMREQIETTFGTKVYNFYGSREASSLAGECKNELLHILPINHVEIVTKHGKHAKPGEEGKVIVTNLFNYSMPFIRYEIGDQAKLGPKKCKCGCILPTLKEVTGRITDHFILENGTVIPAEFFIHIIGVVLNKGLIKQFQVIQEDYRKIRILVVPEENRKVNENNINSKIRKIMGQKCEIKWIYVDNIPKTKSGKYLYTKSIVMR